MSSQHNDIKHENHLSPALAKMVFGNELIMEKILQFVLPNAGDSSIKHILACRLVDHTWHQIATNLLAKQKDPLFTLDFTHWKESQKDQSEMLKRFQVKDFFDTWATTPDTSNRFIPPFKLELLEFSEDNYTAVINDLAKCMMQCGNGIHSLNLNLSSRFLKTYQALPENLVDSEGKLYLPNLQNLTVRIPREENDIPIVFLLVTGILSGSRSLMSLSVYQTGWGPPLPRTRLFRKPSLLGETEYLPTTLQEIDFSLLMTPNLIEKLMLENSLPNLTKLCLSPLKLAHKQVISRILNKFCQQLTDLTLKGLFYTDEGETDQNDRNLATLVQFPVMTKLKCMCLSSLHFEFEYRGAQYFPVLEELIIAKQTNSMLLNLTRNCQLDCVRRLVIRIDGGELSNHAQNFTLDLSRQVSRAFPHVTNLNLFVMGLVEDDSIQNIFEGMTQLQHLSIILGKTAHIRPSAWNAILLGVTQEYAKHLASTPDLWDSVNLGDHRAPSRSILNLTELRSLSLSTIWGIGRRDMLISDVVFRFAFLCMPKLDNLSLSERFEASKEMTTEWRQQGRTISTVVKIWD